jgi:hypothetical protein
VWTTVAQWLRCCTTNWKVANSIPDVVSGIFHWHKSFWSDYGPGVDSASNRNEYQEYFLGVNATGALGWQTHHNPVLLSCNLGTLTSWKPLGHSRPVTGLLYLLHQCRWFLLCSPLIPGTQLYFLCNYNSVRCHNFMFNLFCIWNSSQTRVILIEFSRDFS